MDKKIDVKMTCTSNTSDIGDFKEGEVLPLPDHLARAAVRQKIAEYIDKPIIEKKTKKKREVIEDGGE